MHHSNYTIDFTRLTLRFGKREGISRATRSMEELPKGYFEPGGAHDKMIIRKYRGENLGEKIKKADVRLMEFLSLKNMEEVKNHGFTAAELMRLYSDIESLRRICGVAQVLAEQNDGHQEKTFSLEYCDSVKTVRRRCL